MNQKIREGVRRLLPRAWKPSFDAAAALLFDQGHLESGRTGACTDAAGAPIPWYTYPAIEYLRQLDFRDADVFEYGSGHSTLWWAARARRVVSVEDDRAWYQQLSRRLPAHCELMLETDLYEYPRAIERHGARYDVVIVDGASRGNTRLKCARRAVTALREGGLIVLDNADWLPESARVLREAGLLQVDMTGFGPVNGYSWTTTLFFDRAFGRRARSARQPEAGAGSWPQTWETPPSLDPPIVVCGDDSFGGVRREEPFTIQGPHASERFRWIVSERRNAGMRTLAILDDRVQRVLLTQHEPLADPPALEREFERIATMTWDAFVTFINGNDQRRYDVRPTPPV
jgi:hypothetical protein